ncbi:hypothetical protein [Streptomyces cyaneofuscatus]|uniref:hypothetical protein n=1 Tax=Streptomyces cyaneofuscatus TaxID=66883 RepID=UPI0033BBCBC0
MGRWIIGYPDDAPPPPPVEPDENDHCQTCTGSVAGSFTCVCADQVTPPPHHT